MPSEETPAGTPGEDLKSLPIRAYLDKTVVPILLLGLAETAKERYPTCVSFRNPQTQRSGDVFGQFPSTKQPSSKERIMIHLYTLCLLS